MSDIITNAKRYNETNTYRNDRSGSTRGNARTSGGASIGFDCSGLVYHVLRESGYNVPFSNSGAMINKTTFGENWATAISEENATIRPGTLVYFSCSVETARAHFLGGDGVQVMTLNMGTSLSRTSAVYLKGRSALTKLHWTDHLSTLLDRPSAHYAEFVRCA